MQLNRSSLIIPGIVLGVWLLAGLVLVPVLLESAFRGSGILILSAALAAHPNLTLSFLLEEWHGIVLAGTAAILFLAVLAHVLRRPEFARRFVGKAAPADIGAIRTLVCAVLLISVLWEDLASTAALPREMIRPMGVIQLLNVLPGFDRFIASEFALTLFEWATAAVLFLGMMGWKTRVVLPLGAVAYLIFGGLLRQYAWFYHTGLLALYLLIVLSLLPSHHGCSVDRLTKLWKGENVPSPEPTRQYGWMRYALWATLAIPYVVAGLSKLRNGGLTWWEASNFKFILYQSTLRPMEFDFDASLLLTSAPDFVFEILAISAVAGELLYGLVLFSRRARWIMPATMALMHVGILFFQNILFFDLIVLQAVFFNFRPLAARLRSALARRRLPATLIYDRLLAPRGRLRRWDSAVDVPERADAPHALGGFTVRWRSWIASPKLTVVLVGLLCFFWVFRIEFYPFTGMQMFSKKRTEPVTYEMVLARFRSGEVARAPVEECIGAMSDSRYRRVMQMAFEPAKQPITVAFLDSCRTRWNRRVRRPDDLIEGFEVQQWEWYYLQDPEHPDYGELIHREVFPSEDTESAARRPDSHPTSSPPR